MDMPPTRYKVVERGRRLIVVDAQSGMPVTGLDPEQQARIDGLKRRLGNPEPGQAPEPRRSAPVRSPAPAPMAAGEPQILTTQRWFDDKAPRQVRIDPNRQTGPLVMLAMVGLAGFVVFIMFGWPALVVGGFFLLQMRKGFRGMITKWLDGLEQA